MFSVCPSVRPSVRSSVTKIVMPVGTSGSRGNGMKCSTLGVRRPKVKV